MWKGLADFAWRSSFRTWFYRIARNAAGRHRARPHNQPGRVAPLSQVSELAARVRSRTLTHLRSEVHDQFAKLRASLDEERHMLLVLRLNRGLSFKEVARVMTEEELEDAELDRAAARMRQRFQAIKTSLRQQAEQRPRVSVGGCAQSARRRVGGQTGRFSRLRTRRPPVALRRSPSRKLPRPRCLPSPDVAPGGQR